MGIPSNNLTVETVTRMAVPLTPGVIDDNAREAFTLGQCGVLAAALHDRTGWPLWAVVEYSNDWLSLGDDTDVLHAASSGRPIPWTYLVNLWDHVVVERPDGKFVDILGARDRDTLLAEYDELTGSTAVNLNYSDARHRLVTVDRSTVLDLPSTAKRADGVGDLFVDAVLALPDVDPVPWLYESALRAYLNTELKNAREHDVPAEVEEVVRECLEALHVDYDMLVEAAQRDMLPADVLDVANSILAEHELVPA